jgi:gamma-glutamyltranspeptidase/glutathione hydrolase/leukotriene-C4 hydrolase
VRQVLTADALGYRFLSAPPPSSGGAAVLAIALFLNSYAEPFAGVGEVKAHRLAEAMKHAFAMRMSLGDPAFVNVSAVVRSIFHNHFSTNSLIFRSGARYAGRNIHGCTTGEYE